MREAIEKFPGRHTHVMFQNPCDGIPASLIVTPLTICLQSLSTCIAYLDRYQPTLQAPRKERTAMAAVS